MSLITLNPNDKTIETILSNNNLTVSCMDAPTKYKGVRVGSNSTVDKWYLEIMINSAGNRVCIGMVDSSVDLNGFGSGLTGMPTTVKVLANSGIIYNGNITVPNGSFTTGDIIGLLYNSTTKTLIFRKNNVFLYELQLDITFNWMFAILLFNSSDKATANFGATPFTYPIPEGFLPYDIENASWLSSNKILIKSNEKILSFNNDWVDTGLTEPLTKLDFENFGIGSLLTITGEKWDELDDEFEIINWTIDDEYKWLSVNTDSFIPFEKFTQGKLEVFAYSKDESIPNLQIKGFKNVMRITESSNPKLLIKSTNDNPLIESNLIPYPQLILSTGDIVLKNIVDINELQVVANEVGNGVVKVIYSNDSGTTWKTYNYETNLFENVDIGNLIEVKNKGMTTNIFNSLNSRWMDELQDEKIRFGYYLEIDNKTDVAEVDELIITMISFVRWRKAKKIRDYQYEYVNEKIKISLFNDGSYKINYAE